MILTIFDGEQEEWLSAPINNFDEFLPNRCGTDDYSSSMLLSADNDSSRAILSLFIHA